MPRQYSMEKRAEDLDATRRVILDATVDVAAESGLDALTVQAVAARADVALRTVYNHFESREGLIAAALGRLAEDTRATVRAIEAEGASPRDRLIAFVDAYVRSYEDQGRATRVLMGASGIPVVAAAVADVRAWRRQRLRAMLRDADVHGQLGVPLAEAVNVAYLATAHATYATLREDVGLGAAAVRATVGKMVDRALFDGASDRMS